MAKNPWEETYAVSKNPWEENYGQIKSQEPEPVQPAGPEILPEDDTSSDFMRGIKNALPGIKSTYGAAKVLAGKTLGNKELMASGVEGMKEAETQQKVKASDEFTEAWKQGIGSVLTDWLPYQVGSGLANLAETAGFTLAGAGLGAVTGAGVGAIPGALEGTVAKTLIKKGIKDQAEKLIKEGAKDEAEKLIKNSAKSALIGMGSTLGQAGQAVMHGAGETTGRALSELEQQGKTAEDLNLSKLLPAAGVHSVADFLANKFLMQGAKGLNLKGLSTESTGNLFYDVTKAIASTGAKELLPEEVQTMAERYGASLSLTDAEALKDYINTGAASVAMSIAPGGIGGVRTRLAGKQVGKPGKTTETEETNLQEQFKKEQENADIAAQEHFGLTKNELDQTLIEPLETKQEETIPQENIAETKTNEPEVIPDALQTANEYIAKIDAGQKIKQSEYRQVANALGLKIPVGTKNVDGVQIIRDYLAKQGEQNDGTITEPNRVSPEVSEQREAGTTTKGATEIDNGRVGGSDIIEKQPGTGTEVQSTTLEDPNQKLQNALKKQAEENQKLQNALEKQAEENEKVEKQSVADLEKNTEKQIGRKTTDTGQGILVEDKKIAKPIKYVKGYKETKDPSSLNYLNQNSYYGLEAPLTIEQGLENAGHEEAFDSFDAVSYEKDIKPILKEKADAINKQRAEQRQAILNKEGRYSAATEAEAKTAANQIKDVSDEKPLEFMTLDELEELYRSKIDKNLELEGEQSRKNAAANRQKFIEGLTPFQKLQVEKAEKEAFRKEVESTTSLGPTKTSDKRKNREAALEGRRLKAEQEIKEQLSEDEAEAAAEKEIARRKPLLKEAPVVQVSARVRSNIEKAVNENNAEKVLSAIADDREMTFGKRVASAFKDLVKTFGDLKIEFGNIEDNGQFNPANNTITLKGENGKYTGERNIVETVLHEVGHYLTDHVVDNKEAYIKSLPKERQPIVRAALNRLDNNYRYAKSKLGDKFNIPTIKEFIAETYSNPKFQEALANLDTGQPMIEKVMEEQREIVGTKETRYMAEREREIPGPPKRQYAMPKESLFQKIVKNIASVFGFEIKGEGDLKNKPTAAVTLKETLEDIARIISLPTANIRGKEISYASTKSPKQAPFLEITNAYEENPAFAIPENLQQTRLNNVIKQYFSPKGIQETIRIIQNKNQWTKNLERQLNRAGLLSNIDPNKKNDFNTEQTLWSGRGKNKYHDSVESLMNGLQQNLVEFAKTNEIIKATEKVNIVRKKKNPSAKDLSTVDFMQGVLHIYSQAFTDKERRLNMFVQTSPLDNVNKIVPWQGKLISVAKFREELLGNSTLNKPGLFDTDMKLTNEQARKLWLQLESYVFTKDANGEKIPNTKYVVPGGFSPDGRKATDFKSNDGNTQYNVTGFTYQETEKILDQYKNDKNKDLLDKILDTTYKINDISKEFNRSSNYISIPASNWIAAYGYERYVPLKGITAHTPTARRVGLEFNGKMLETELIQTAIKSEGRFSVSNNPILQSINDSFISLVRAGKGPGYTLALRNLVEKSPTKIDNKMVDLNPNGQGHIKGKVIEHIPFYDRSADKIKNVRKDNTIFHHNEDGSIDVIEIGDKKALESIRVPFKKSNPFVEMANSITSTLGQFHTRYNVNFAPLNFNRDVLTNAWTMGAEFGPETAAKLIQQISVQVATKNSLGKAFKFAGAYKKPGFEESFKNSTDPVKKNMYELIIEGGMTEYMDSISIRSNLDKLNKQLDRNKILKAKDQADKIIDVWTNMFELASRSAAYGVIKQHYMSEAGGKLSEEEARIRTASYVKNLANFEQVGEMGKLAGSFYMFFRPSATGAVRALEALAPAFPGSLERALENLPESIKKDPEALKKYTDQYKFEQRSARIMSTALMGLGALAYTMSYMMSDTDDQNRNKVLTDDMNQWNRNWRIFIPGFEKPFQIPWGFGLGAFAAMGAQLAAAVSGQQSLTAAIKNGATQISLDSFVPIPVSRMDITDNPAMWAVDSIAPSVIRPVIEFVANKNGLGQDIYNDATGRRLGDAFLGGDRIPEIYKIISRNLSEATYGYFDWTPNSLYFLTNSYADGPARLIDTSLNAYYLATGYKQFDSKTDLPFLGSFVGTAPNIDNREFSSIEKQIQDMTGIVNQFKKFDPDYYYSDYLVKYPMNEAIIKVYDETLPVLNKLRADKKLIEGSKYDLATRKELLNINKQQQDMVKYNLVQMFKSYGVNP